MSNKMRLGGHLSAASGLRHVIVNARALDYSVVQIMLGNGRDYSPLDVSGTDAQEFQKMAYGMGIYVHMPYVINPCEDGGSRKGFYKRSFREFAEAATAIGARGLVIHPGFKKELEPAVAYRNLVKFFESIYNEDWRLQILLETDSGSKNSSAIGSPEFIYDALVELGHENYGMCLDTVHMYARGVDLWDEAVRTPFLEKYRRVIKLVHLNSPDPKCTMGSNVDLHNTPFEDRVGWDHKGLFEALQGFPCILERRSIAVQEQDARYIRTTLNLKDDDGYQLGNVLGGIQDPA